MFLICTDPDGLDGIVHHWAVYDIPSNQHVLGEGVPPSGAVRGMKQAFNDFFHDVYAGPRPPADDGIHRYHFRLFALSVYSLKVRETPTCAEVLREARRHVLAAETLVGVYERRSAHLLSHTENYAHAL